jgi:hypothetical protein
LALDQGFDEGKLRADIIFIGQLTKLPAARRAFQGRNGRIVIDANNPIEAPLFKPSISRAAFQARSSPISCPARAS